MVAPAPAPLRPSGWWYLATIGIAAVGLVVAVVLLVDGIRSAQQVADEVTSVEPGQSGLVTFESAGSFVVYYAGPPKAVVEADMRLLEQDVAADLRPEAGGPPVPMQPYESADLGITSSDEGQVVALSTFSIDGAGTYVLRTETVDGVSPTESRIIVGKSLYAPLAQGALLALVAVGISGVLSLVASVALGVTRGRAKRARASGASGGAWGPTPAWPAAPPGQWAGPPPIIPPRPPGYGQGEGERHR